MFYQLVEGEEMAVVGQVKKAHIPPRAGGFHIPKISSKHTVHSPKKSQLSSQSQLPTTSKVTPNATGPSGSAGSYNAAPSSSVFSNINPTYPTNTGGTSGTNMVNTSSMGTNIAQLENDLANLRKDLQDNQRAMMEKLIQDQGFDRNAGIAAGDPLSPKISTTTLIQEYGPRLKASHDLLLAELENEYKQKRDQELEKLFKPPERSMAGGVNTGRSAGNVKHKFYMPQDGETVDASPEMVQKLKEVFIQNANTVFECKSLSASSREGGLSASREGSNGFGGLNGSSRLQDTSDQIFTAISTSAGGAIIMGGKDEENKGPGFLVVDVQNYCLCIEMELRQWMGRLARLDCWTDKTETLEDVLLTIRNRHPRTMISWDEFFQYFTRAGFMNGAHYYGQSCSEGSFSAAKKYEQKKQKKDLKTTKTTSTKAQHEKKWGVNPQCCTPIRGGKSRADVKKEVERPPITGLPNAQVGGNVVQKPGQKSASSAGGVKGIKTGMKKTKKEQQLEKNIKAIQDKNIDLQQSLDEKTKQAMLSQAEDLKKMMGIASNMSPKKGDDSTPVALPHKNPDTIKIRNLMIAHWQTPEKAYQALNILATGKLKTSDLVLHFKACGGIFENVLNDGTIERAVAELRDSEMNIDLRILLGLVRDNDPLDRNFCAADRETEASNVGSQPASQANQNEPRIMDPEIEYNRGVFNNRATARFGVPGTSVIITNEEGPLLPNNDRITVQDNGQYGENYAKNNPLVPKDEPDNIRYTFAQTNPHPCSPTVSPTANPRPVGGNNMSPTSSPQQTRSSYMEQQEKIAAYEKSFMPIDVIHWQELKNIYDAVCRSLNLQRADLKRFVEKVRAKDSVISKNNWLNTVILEPEIDAINAELSSSGFQIKHTLDKCLDYLVGDVYSAVCQTKNPYCTWNFIRKQLVEAPSKRKVQISEYINNPNDGTRWLVGNYKLDEQSLNRIHDVFKHCLRNQSNSTGSSSTGGTPRRTSSTSAYVRKVEFVLQLKQKAALMSHMSRTALMEIDSFLVPKWAEILPGLAAHEEDLLSWTDVLEVIKARCDAYKGISRGLKASGALSNSGPLSSRLLSGGVGGLAPTSAGSPQKPGAGKNQIITSGAYVPIVLGGTDDSPLGGANIISPGLDPNGLGPNGLSPNLGPNNIGAGLSPISNKSDSIRNQELTLPVNTQPIVTQIGASAEDILRQQVGDIISPGLGLNLGPNIGCSKKNSALKDISSPRAGGAPATCVTATQGASADTIPPPDLAAIILHPDLNNPQFLVGGCAARTTNGTTSTAGTMKSTSGYSKVTEKVIFAEEICMILDTEYNAFMQAREPETRLEAIRRRVNSIVDPCTVALKSIGRAIDTMNPTKFGKMLEIKLDVSIIEHKDKIEELSGMGGAPGTSEFRRSFIQNLRKSFKGVDLDGHLGYRVMDMYIGYQKVIENNIHLGNDVVGFKSTMQDSVGSTFSGSENQNRIDKLLTKNASSLKQSEYNITTTHALSQKELLEEERKLSEWKANRKVVDRHQQRYDRETPTTTAIKAPDFTSYDSYWEIKAGRRIRDNRFNADMREKEKAEIHSTNLFRANPIPQHVYMPKYSQMELVEKSRAKASKTGRGVKCLNGKSRGRSVSPRATASARSGSMRDLYEGKKTWDKDYAPITRDFSSHARYQLYKANRSTSVPPRGDKLYKALFKDGELDQNGRLLITQEEKDTRLNAKDYDDEDGKIGKKKITSFLVGKPSQPQTYATLAVPCNDIESHIIAKDVPNFRRMHLKEQQKNVERRVKNQYVTKPEPFHFRATRRTLRAPPTEDNNDVTESKRSKGFGGAGHKLKKTGAPRMIEQSNPHLMPPKSTAKTIEREKRTAQLIRERREREEYRKAELDRYLGQTAGQGGVGLSDLHGGGASGELGGDDGGAGPLPGGNDDADHDADAEIRARVKLTVGTNNNKQREVEREKLVYQKKVGQLSTMREYKSNLKAMQERIRQRPLLMERTQLEQARERARQRALLRIRDQLGGNDDYFDQEELNVMDGY